MLKSPASQSETWSNTLRVTSGLKGTQRDRTLKHGFNQAFAGRKVFVSYENVFLFQ